MLSFSIALLLPESIDLWLSLLVKHDTDKGFYNISFPEDRCEVIITDKNDAATCNDVMQILRT